MMPDQSIGLTNVFPTADNLPCVKDSEHVLTHGYIHGHVHQHDDHMHIHGHIHNHDHQSCKSEKLTESDTCTQLGRDCDGIFCHELDDCYFGDCENPKVCDVENCSLRDCVNVNCANEDLHEVCDIEPCSDDVCSGNLSEIECCEDPSCLRDAEAICQDPRCIENHDFFDHENNLCESQLQRLEIFRNLLENVQKSVELLRDSGKEDHTEVKIKTKEALLENPAAKRRKIHPKKHDNIQIHFPHRCHRSSENGNLKPEGASETSPETIPSVPLTDVVKSIEPHHNIHQSCFHARVPSYKQEYVPSALAHPMGQNDFDFFLQFNNFNLLFGEESGKLEPQAAYNNSAMQPQSPNAPSSYSCKWENCCKKVDDKTLLNHLIDDHINEEYSLDNRERSENQAFQCEWFNCGFANEDYESFVSHLSTHKGLNDNLSSSCPATVDSALKGSPLLTPSSIVSSLGSPKTLIKKEESSPNSGVSITQMEIKPKKALCCQPVDPLFTCNWQVGIDIDNKPVICGKVHASDGDLQAHLQQDHIGLGKRQYKCCWVGCERNGGKPFMQRQKLYRHIHIHTNYKPCKCEICGASFAVAATLKQHMRIHSGEKPFACKDCDKKFTTSSALAIHTRVHSGEKPLQCLFPGCGKSFSESSNLAKHKRVHQKRFTCEECGVVFDQKKLYTKHRRTHAQGSDGMMDDSL